MPFLYQKEKNILIPRDGELRPKEIFTSRPCYTQQFSLWGKLWPPPIMKVQTSNQNSKSCPQSFLCTKGVARAWWRGSRGPFDLGLTHTNLVVFPKEVIHRYYNLGFVFIINSVHILFEVLSWSCQPPTFFVIPSSPLLLLQQGSLFLQGSRLYLCGFISTSQFYSLRKMSLSPSYK